MGGSVISKAAIAAAAATSLGITVTPNSPTLLPSDSINGGIAHRARRSRQSVIALCGRITTSKAANIGPAELDRRSQMVTLSFWVVARDSSEENTKNSIGSTALSSKLSKIRSLYASCFSPTQPTCVLSRGRTLSIAPGHEVMCRTGFTFHLGSQSRLKYQQRIILRAE